MDFETVDILFRSRQTLLDILKDKGYNVTPYLKFGPFEIESMASSSKEGALRMDLVKEDGGKCRVEYAIPRVKNRLTGFLNKLLTEHLNILQVFSCVSLFSKKYFTADNL